MDAPPKPSSTSLNEGTRIFYCHISTAEPSLGIDQANQTMVGFIYILEMKFKY